MLTQNKIDTEIQKIIEFFDNNDTQTHQEYYRLSKKSQPNYFIQPKQEMSHNPSDFLQNLKQIPFDLLESFKGNINCAYQNFKEHYISQQKIHSQPDYLKQNNIINIDQNEIQEKASEMNCNEKLSNYTHQQSLDKKNKKENYCQLLIKILALFDSHQFIYELLNQTKLYNKYHDHLKKNHQFNNIEFRFGQNYKDLFKGKQYETIIVLYYILLNMFNNQLKIKINKNSLIILYKYNYKENNFFFEIQDYLSQQIKTSMHQLIENLLETIDFSCDYQYKPQQDELKIQIDLKQLEKNYKFQCNKNKYFFEFNQKIVFVWMISNFVSNIYIDYYSCIKHFNNYILDLIGLNLNIKTDNRGRILITNKQIFPISDKEEKNLILKYKELSITKQYYEVKYDFIQCLKYLDIKELCSIDQLVDIIQEKKNDKQQKRNQNLCDSHFDLIFMQYYNFDFNLQSFLVVQYFIQKQFQNKVFNTFDQSTVVQIIQRLNTQYLQFLKIQQSIYRKLENPQILHKSLIQNKSDLISYDRINKLEYYLQGSEQVYNGLLKQIENENNILENVVCFYNIQQKWIKLKKEMQRIILLDKDVDEQQFQNTFIPNQNSFSTYKLKFRIIQPTFDRKMLPEEFIHKECWDLLYPQIERMEWEVQNGLVLWFYIFVYQQQFQSQILQLLKFFKLKKIKRRKTAISFFGQISRFFKFISHLNQIQGFDNFIKNIDDQNLLLCLKQDPEIFINIETAFGKQVTSKKQDEDWDKEFMQHTISWTNGDTKEKLFDLDITKDFELCLQNLFTDLHQTKSLNSIENQSQNIIYLDNLSSNTKINKMFDKIQINEKDSYIDRYYVKQNQNMHISYKSFSKFAENFYRFSANGSAQGAKVKLKETKIFKQIKKQNKVLYKKIKSNYKEDDKMGISKTICFGYSGSYLLKLLFWVYGQNYTPYYELNLKNEPKKIRQIANSDLISFSKQTYFFDWISQVLNENTKLRIHNYLTKLQKLQFFKTSQNIKNNEKWNVELDMKDFHIHFGRSHYRAFSKVMKDCINNSVFNDEIRRDLLIIAESFKEDLGRGKLKFCKILKGDNLFQDFIQNKYGITINKKKSQNVGYKYTASFPIKNGLMSGWKLTSFFGSIFNLTLNQMCEKWILYQTGGINLNLNVMGDDVHLKKRFLHEAITHIAFNNLIGKQAHPEKQMISTVMIEFLKTKVSQIDQNLKYHAINILNQLLYFNLDQASQTKQSDYFSTQIDIINLFYNRINTKIKNKLLKYQFHLNFLRFCCKLSKKDFSNFEIYKFINNPSIFNGFLPGHLRQIRYDFQQTIDITQDLRVLGFNDLLKVYELKLKPSQFQGIRQNVCSLSSNIHFFNSIQKKQFNKKLVFKIGRKMLEKKGFYTLEKNSFVENKKLQILQMNQANIFVKNKFSYWKEIKVQILSYDNQIFDIKHFLQFSLEQFQNVIYNEVDYQGVIGQLVYIDEQVSQIIFQMIKDQISKDDKNYLKQIYQNLKLLLKKCDTGFHIFWNFINKYGEEFFFFLALQNFLKLKVSKLLKNDSLIGFVGEQIQKFFIIYLIEEVPDNKVNDIKENFLSILCTLDYYIHENINTINQKIQSLLFKKHILNQQNEIQEFIEELYKKKQQLIQIKNKFV